MSVFVLQIKTNTKKFTEMCDKFTPFWYAGKNQWKVNTNCNIYALAVPNK